MRTSAPRMGDPAAAPGILIATVIILMGIGFAVAACWQFPSAL